MDKYIVFFFQSNLDNATYEKNIYFRLCKITNYGGGTGEFHSLKENGALKARLLQAVFFSKMAKEALKR